MVITSRAELETKYDLGSNSFQGLQLEGLDLEGISLPGIDLSNAKLKGVNLTGANLEGACLNLADLSEAILTDANLQGSSLTRANLAHANLIRANISQAKLVGACLDKARIQKANLSCSFLTIAALHHAYLNEANLEGTYLNGAKLKEAHLQGACLRGANLDKARLAGAYYNNHTIFEPGFNPLQVGMECLGKECSITQNLATPSLTIPQALETLNYVYQTSLHYLGKLMATKYWQSSRPDSTWLEQFSFNSTSIITFTGKISQILQQEEISLLKLWMQNFIQACSVIVLDFSQMIEAEKLFFRLHD